jgi:peptide chain release factor 1
LKFEAGVHHNECHKETQGRVHTSAATVMVLPEAENLMQIDMNDVSDFFCSSGPGGQSVNTTKSAVRFSHSTGLVAQCQDQKSQHKIRHSAFYVPVYTNRN